jgi:hypothetical protein
MKRRTGSRTSMSRPDRGDDTFDLTALLHPAQAFAKAMDVVNDLDLTLSEKRAILAAWASDACAVEAATALRRALGHPPVEFDDIMDALRVLDQQAAQRSKPIPHYRRVLARRGLSVPDRTPRRMGESGDQGPRLH